MRPDRPCGAPDPACAFAIRSVNSRKVTVLVTHWWEYFANGQPNEAFIRVLHQTADYLAAEKDVRVISFTELANSGVELN